MQMEFDIINRGCSVEMVLAPENDEELALFRGIENLKERFRIVFDASVIIDVMNEINKSSYQS